MLKQFTFIFVLLLSFVTIQGQDWVQIGADIDGEAAGDGFGSSVSISADGSVLAIGAIFNDGKGHVRVYKNVEGTWVQVGADIDGEEANDLFGNSVSLSANGSVVAIGTPNSNKNGSQSGHVRIYKNVENTWTQIGDDIVGQAEGDKSGKSVSLNADGSVVAIGAPYNNGNGDESGQVRVYKNIDGVWVQVGNDIYGEAKEDWAGRSISLNADGSLIAIGSPLNDESGSQSGQVRVYKNIDGNWEQVGENINGRQEGEKSGFSVSLNADGTTVAVGVPLNNANGEKSGQVRVYYYKENAWIPIGGNISGQQANDWSGWDVSINADGSVVAVGSPYNSAKGSETGQVCVYQNINELWNKVGEYIIGEEAGDKFGWAVSLSAKGSIVSIGGLGNDGNGSYSGHVRVFKNSYLDNTEELQELGIAIYPNPTSDIVNFDFGENKIQKLTVLDITGRNVFVKTNITPSEAIDFSDFTNGIYVIKINCGDKILSTKIIKE